MIIIDYLVKRKGRRWKCQSSRESSNSEKIEPTYVMVLTLIRSSIVLDVKKLDFPNPNCFLAISCILEAGFY